VIFFVARSKKQAPIRSAYPPCSSVVAARSKPGYSRPTAPSCCEQTNASITKWRLTGDYFENCNCDVHCPCTASQLQARPTQGECNVALTVHINEGAYGDVSLDGLNVVMVLHTPGVMAEGNGTAALYIAYVVPIAFALRARWTRPEWTSEAVWTLGRFGAILNCVAVVYTVGICFVLVMPPNALAGKTLVGLFVMLTFFYLVYMRQIFSGPQWTHST